MKTIGWDTETHLIKPGCGAPKLVCVTFAEEGTRGAGQILDHVEGMRWIKDKLGDSGIRLAAHHAPYDLGIACAEDPEVIPMVYDAIDTGRIGCTLLRQKILQNALGELKYQWDDELGQYKAQRFGLEYVVLRTLNRVRAKGEDTWRLRYRELDGVPIDKWPAAAVEYAIFDAEDTKSLDDYQYNLEPDITGEVWQTEAAWALHLASVWGMRTDPERVARVKERFTTEWQNHVKIAQEWGLVRKDAKLSKDTKAIGGAVREWFALNDAGPVPETPTGKVSLKREVLVGTDHPGLRAVAEMGKWRKLLTTYVPVLEQGTTCGINPSYNAILETFRTSCRKPNMQNLPRKGGVRECFVPRKGWTFAFCDYDTLEMRSLAQICFDLFGFSDLRDALKEGKDLHLDMAAEILGIPYEEAERRLKAGDREVKETRQHSKPANFGFPGGMGARKFILYAANYGIELAFEQAKHLRDTFMAKWSEMGAYFEYCSGLVGGDVADVVEFLRSGMLRGDVMYTALCNGFFQHLAAMGAKQALYEISRACYVTKSSPLFGCRPIAFLHDEIGVEIPPYVDNHLAAKEIERIMIEVMSKWIPDVPITCGAVLMKRWFKGAEPFIHEGRLVPCKPVKTQTGTVWEMDESN